MADDVKEARFRRLAKPLEIDRPDFKWIAILPFGDVRRIIHRPGVGDIMDRADKIIPGMARRQVTNPLLMTGQEIDFHGQLDDEVGELFLSAADFLDVLIQLIQAHAPFVEIVLLHRRMVGEADFIKPQFNCARRIFHRLAGGMAAERRVHVIIRWPTHGISVERKEKKVERKASTALPSFVAWGILKPACKP